MLNIDRNVNGGADEQLQRTAPIGRAELLSAHEDGAQKSGRGPRSQGDSLNFNRSSYLLKATYQNETGRCSSVSPIGTKVMSQNLLQADRMISADDGANPGRHVPPPSSSMIQQQQQKSSNVIISTIKVPPGGDGHHDATMTTTNISHQIISSNSLINSPAPTTTGTHSSQGHQSPSARDSGSGAGTTTSQTNATANQTRHSRSAAATSAPNTPNSNPIRYRMSQASDQLSFSLKQLYASASSISETVHPPSYQNIPGIVPYYHGRSIGPPPSYDDVINPYAPPPTYQSLFGQMREARKTSRSLLDLLRRLFIIVVSTLGCTLLIAFMILIPFTMIIVGAIYIDECQIEHIPAFLLVGGLVWASKNVIHCYGQCKQQQQQQHQQQQQSMSDSQSLGDLFNQTNNEHSQSAAGGDNNNTGESNNLQPTNDETQQQRQQHANNHQRLKSSICESLLNCVLFGWFIAGCVIIFRNYEPDFENSASSRYCHRTVYMYTFWLITSALMLFGLFISCICCLMVSSVVANRQDVSDLA